MCIYLYVYIIPKRHTFRRKQNKLFKYTNENPYIEQSEQLAYGNANRKEKFHHLGTARVDDSLFCN